MNARHTGNDNWGWQILILVGLGNDGKIKYFGAMLFYLETKEIFRFVLDSRQKLMGQRTPLKTQIVFVDSSLNQSDIREGQFYFADMYHTKQSISNYLGKYLSARVGLAGDKAFCQKLKKGVAITFTLLSTYCQERMLLQG
ncbi:hypothetical protein SARC_03778 [Sphaeroforma arctica JP610]|uniref:Uncharacterized protein n=1 Tax=Sphaeroforma arctica JP610 TaxID=667725 RepID=A0A0L0G4L6_9EUKA|nr:hypothetical protein SARC_03778 [Sphaeroforma arctica JP610]KNC83990.1 hypothetical protein SARC_03778 [Sphaeroforma arctica JP610]|eukprot:XP_014157892.1 hypothetical protein SARC_03778 [Sphaeroforma arctica JP610]